MQLPLHSMELMPSSSHSTNTQQCTQPSTKPLWQLPLTTAPRLVQIQTTLGQAGQNYS